MGKEYEATKSKLGGEGRANKNSSDQSGHLISEKPKGRTMDVCELHTSLFRTPMALANFANV